MTPELHILTLTTLFTALMWAPYITNSMLVRGVMPTLRNPDPNAAPLSPWAERAKRAHANAVENLVVFASLVLAIQAAERSSPEVATAAATYLGARVVHFFVYMAGVPVVRTLAFLVGFGCQVALAVALLDA